MAATQHLSIPLKIQAAFLFLAIFAFTIKTGEAIMCWECNSHYDKNCADPFRNKTFDPTDCDMKDLEHFPNKKARICRKIIQKVKDDYRLIRGCGYLSSEKENTDCIKRAGTFNVLVQYCSCNTDVCNGSDSMIFDPTAWATNIFFPAITLFIGVAVKGWKKKYHAVERNK